MSHQIPLPHYSVPDVEYLNEIEFENIPNDDAVALGLITAHVIQ